MGRVRAFHAPPGYFVGRGLSACREWDVRLIDENVKPATADGFGLSMVRC